MMIRKGIFEQCMESVDSISLLFLVKYSLPCITYQDNYVYGTSSKIASFLLIFPSNIFSFRFIFLQLYSLLNSFFLNYILFPFHS